jgi:ribosomal subunit interface protein
MRVQVAGRHMDVGEALRARITAELTERIAQYLSRATDAQVTVTKARVGCEVDCVVHFSSGITLQAEGQGGDAHLAFSEALDKIAKRVRRYKRRLKNHHADNKSPLPAEDALAYVLAPLAEAEEEDAAGDPTPAERESGAPLVIAETTAAVRTMPVAMAVMQLDLMEEPALLFRNAANGGLNMVYRRSDGNIGWVDPGRTNGKVNGA